VTQLTELLPAFDSDDDFDTEFEGFFIFYDLHVAGRKNLLSLLFLSKHLDKIVTNQTPKATPGKMLDMDEHPKATALLFLAGGICVIGIILAATFSDNDGLLGAGIALGVLGAALIILGIIHLTSLAPWSDPDGRRKKHDDDIMGPGGEMDMAPQAQHTSPIAPNRVPSPGVISRGRIAERDVEEAGGALHYEEFTATPSPRRGPRIVVDAGGATPGAGNRTGAVRWGGGGGGGGSAVSATPRASIATTASSAPAPSVPPLAAPVDSLAGASPAAFSPSSGSAVSGAEDADDALPSNYWNRRQTS
jgi:hypothetical protein